jgi:hypothetical protein
MRNEEAQALISQHKLGGCGRNHLFAQPDHVLELVADFLKSTEQPAYCCISIGCSSRPVLPGVGITREDHPIGIKLRLYNNGQEQAVIQLKCGELEGYTQEEHEKECAVKTIDVDNNCNTALFQSIEARLIAGGLKLVGYLPRDKEYLFTFFGKTPGKNRDFGMIALVSIVPTKP